MGKQFGLHVQSYIAKRYILTVHWKVHWNRFQEDIHHDNNIINLIDRSIILVITIILSTVSGKYLVEFPVDIDRTWYTLSITSATKKM